MDPSCYLLLKWAFPISCWTPGKQLVSQALCLSKERMDWHICVEAFRGAGEREGGLACQCILTWGHLNPMGMHSETYTGYLELRELRIPPMSTH